MPQPRRARALPVRPKRLTFSSTIARPTHAQPLPSAPMAQAPASTGMGREAPASPVVLSVPHAGRDYPPALLAALRGAGRRRWSPLEDRHVDAVALAARGARTMLVASACAGLDRPQPRRGRTRSARRRRRALGRPVRSAKVRSGLGLVPRRAASAGELVAAAVQRRRGRKRGSSATTGPIMRRWRRRWRRRAARFGVAVLLDLHSMPPLGTGERAGRDRRPVRASGGGALRRADRRRWRAARGCRSRSTRPMPAAICSTATARRGRGIHAVQVEIDRALYLDAALDRPGTGLATTAALASTMLDCARGRSAARPRRWPHGRRIKNHPALTARGGQGSGRRHAREHAIRAAKGGTRRRTRLIWTNVRRMQPVPR